MAGYPCVAQLNGSVCRISVESLIFLLRMFGNEKIFQTKNQDGEPGEATQYCICIKFLK